MSETTVAIFGLGLIGGSLGGALRAAGGWRVVGYDPDRGVSGQALSAGLVDRLANDAEDALDGAGLVVLAAPVSVILRYLGEFSRMALRGVTVLDVGSTKADIVAAMEALPEGCEAVGGHPMAGKLTAGVDGADADLFRNKIFIHVATSRTGKQAEQLVSKVIDDIGAVGVAMDAKEHDKVVSLISHLPHFLPAALLLATEERDNDLYWKLSAGGFRSATSAIMDNPKMWDDIGANNAAEIAGAMRSVSSTLNELADIFETRDNGKIKEVIGRAQELFIEKVKKKS